MPLADTQHAIGGVTNLIAGYLNERTGGLDLTVGRPQQGATNGLSASRLNLFLYEAHFEPTLKNVSLDDGQPSPLWLVLKYLLTAFDTDGESDSAEAHEVMGRGLRALQELSYLFLDHTPPLDSRIRQPLEDNPEVLKLTFDAIDAELIAKLMQGTEEHYRFSMGFQVRPVMIATGELPTYSLLVGVDYTGTVPVARENGSVQIPVIPSMGPTIEAVHPPQVALNEALTITGTDLHLSGLVACFGGIDLPARAQRPDRLECRVDVEGLDISAGSHALSVVQILPGGRRRSSNLLVSALRPTLSDPVAVTLNPAPEVTARIVVAGSLLGREGDDIIVGLYRDGRIVRVYDRQDAVPAEPSLSRLIFPATDTERANQSSLTLELRPADTVPADVYRLILRVNGQQAHSSPIVNLNP